MVLGLESGGLALEELLIECVEVDEAVREAGRDPAGGRGVNGRIGEQLAVKDPDGAVESAV